MLLIFSAGVIFDAYRRFVEGSDPGGILMMAMAFIAAVFIINIYPFAPGGNTLVLAALHLRIVAEGAGGVPQQA